MVAEHFQAITVSYLAQTNKRPGRWRARSSAGYITRANGYTNDDEEAIKIAWTLARKFGWIGYWFGGMLKNGDRVYVMADYTVFKGLSDIEGVAFVVREDERKKRSR